MSAWLQRVRQPRSGPAPGGRGAAGAQLKSSTRVKGRKCRGLNFMNVGEDVT